jgi:aryl-alcohol dehydrogenase-like predicted oxidoreductase
LFFKKTEELPAFFSPIKNKLQHIQNIAGKLQMQLNELLIAFVFSHTQIDRIVFGVDKPSDLNENLIETDLSKIAPAINELKALSESNEQLILPIHWKS